MRSKVSVPLVEVIPKNRLPTELTVLGHYLWRINNKRYAQDPIGHIARGVLNEVLAIWNLAYIPTMTVENAYRKIKRKNGLIHRLVICYYGYYCWLLLPSAL